jgi:hypothetical protein
VARATADVSPASVLSQELLLSLAEQLKVPFLQIARQAELATLTQELNQLSGITTAATGALRLIDNYILGVQLAHQPGYIFDTEPVSVSSVLYDATAELLPMAQAYGVSLDLDIGGKFTPVMAHRRGLQAALVSLGYALIEALPANETTQLRLQFSAHRCRYGVVAGVYCDVENLSTKTLRQGRKLHGQARQPLIQLSPSSGAGVFVADAILQAMQTQLTTSRHHNLHGLAAVLQPNPQLQLI